MNGSAKITLVVFFQILSPLLVVGGLMINRFSNEGYLILDSSSGGLNWFQENFVLSQNLSMGLFIAGGVFALIAILLSISIAYGLQGSDDESLGKSFDKA
jgi:hypothetical protein